MTDLNFYFIALVPESGLLEEVKRLKEMFRERFHAKHALKSPAHITLRMPFRWPSAKEHELILALDECAYVQRPFIVTLSGFGAFPPKVIFIKVKSPELIIELHDHLKSYLIERLGFKTEEIPKPFRPHMTLATRDLSKPNFRKAWNEMKNQAFESEFYASRLVLLKHNGKFWEIFHESLFENTQ